MAPLHTTESAAKFLGVSPATVRRLSDTGALAVQRVGGRRVRRFAEADLKHLLKSGRLSEHGAGTKRRGASLAGARLPLHSHLPTFYDSDAGRLRLAVPFLRDGLLAGQPCLLIARDEIRQQYLAALRDDPKQPVRDSRVREFLLEVPGFGGTPGAAVGEWEHAVWRAMSGGASLCRVVGEMASLRRALGSDAAMLEYERALDSLTKRLPCVVLCQFDVREFDGATVLGAIKAHADVFKFRLSSLLA